jgi:hypothetical protein
MGEADWENYLVEADAKLESVNSEARLYGRVRSGGSTPEEAPESYFLRIKGDGSWQVVKSFIRTTDGAERNPSLDIPYKNFIVTLDEGKPGSLELRPGKWFRLGLYLNKKRVIAIFNGKQITNFTDTNAIQNGMIGLGTSFDNGCFARLKITPVSAAERK